MSNPRSPRGRRARLRGIVPAVLFALLLPAAALHASDEGDEKAAEAIPKLPEKVTFHEHIAEIIYDSCTSCHRPGQVGPFSFTSYEEVRKRARLIRRVTQKRYMPPWHPVEGHGEFRGERRLTDAQIELIGRWVEQGTPEGDSKNAKQPPEFSTEWYLGEPDLVVTMKEAYPVPASGPDIYRNFVIPLDLDEEKWVSAIEIRPSARSVVHHSLYYYDDRGFARQADGQDGKPGFFRMNFNESKSLGGWAVGGMPGHLPLGLAYRLPAGADLILSTHFHPSGKPEMEKTTVGIYFREKKPERRFMTFQTPAQYGAFARLRIPAGHSDYKLWGSFELPVDTLLVGVSAHAHYLGKSMDSWARLPDGSRKPLFRIDDWDFNWQGDYVYEEPFRLPAGTVIETVVTYDNSAANPSNPTDPPRNVRWGLQSTDEMGSLIFGCAAANEEEASELYDRIRANRRGRLALGRGGHGEKVELKDREPESSGGSRRRGGGGFLERLQKLDKNKDGKLERSEVPSTLHEIFDRLDRNGDGVLDSKDRG